MRRVRAGALGVWEFPNCHLGCHQIYYSVRTLTWAASNQVQLIKIIINQVKSKSNFTNPWWKEQKQDKMRCVTFERKKVKWKVVGYVRINLIFAEFRSHWGFAASALIGLVRSVAYIAWCWNSTLTNTNLREILLCKWEYWVCLLADFSIYVIITLYFRIYYLLWILKEHERSKSKTTDRFERASLGKNLNLLCSTLYLSMLFDFITCNFVLFVLHKMLNVFHNEFV